jgi:lipoate-protein ligase A
MDVYFLDLVSWEHSQTLYHAAAYLGREAFFILRPDSPYVCLGYHQDAEQEIDLDFARERQIPIIRREVGGGAVYLDSGQLFYQIVIDKTRSQIPPNKEAFYKKFLQPIVETYRDFGVYATYKPINDIIANGRKVSGNGAAEINNMLVLVGNFILDFNYEMMTKILRVPDEKFRDKIFKTLRENLSTIIRETGSLPETKDLAEALLNHFDPLLGPFNLLTSVDSELLNIAEQRQKEMCTDEWLFENDQRGKSNREVKIREGVYVVQNVLKTPGGLIRVTGINRDGVLHDIHISGDFFVYPADRLPELENALENTPATAEAIQQTIVEFYQQSGVEIPGVQPEDFTKALIPEV